MLTPERHLAGLQKSFFASQSRDWSIVFLDGLNHLFQTAATGSAQEYGVLDETFAPLALRAVGDWLAARFLDPQIGDPAD